MDPAMVRAIGDWVRKAATPELAARLRASGLVLALTDSAEATRALIAADASGARIE